MLIAHLQSAFPIPDGLFASARSGAARSGLDWAVALLWFWWGGGTGLAALGGLGRAGRLSRDDWSPSVCRCVSAWRGGAAVKVLPVRADMMERWTALF